MTEKVIDLRSDTVTTPTREMREAMFRAEVGDDGRLMANGKGGDPTVRKLEEKAATMLGKEEALFMPSGTMGNTVAMLTHCQKGDKICLEPGAHVYQKEKVGFMKQYFEMVPIFVESELGKPNPTLVSSCLLKHKCGLVWLENTNNNAGGTCLTVEDMKELYNVSKEKGIPVHTDGARLFNAAVALKVDAKKFAMFTDTLMVCLSKGLGSPIGSLLLGRREFINRARNIRKLMGGGMRQGGIVAAAGIISLSKMVNRLSEDHRRARHFADELSTFGLLIDMKTVQTNMVKVDVSSSGMSAEVFANCLKEYGVLVSPISASELRFVTHYDISDPMIEQAIKCVRKVLNEGALDRRLS